MKEKVNSFLNWFEERFNFIIDITALVGAIFTIGLAIYFFIIGIYYSFEAIGSIEIIMLPGFLGFMAIIMLFALRITRHLTKKE